MSDNIPILIVNFNDSFWLKHTLASLREMDQSCQEVDLYASVMIIDNASSDNSYDVISNFCRKGTENIQFEAIWLPDNVGFIKANNYGIRLGLDLKDVKYIATLNPDTWVSQEWLSSLYKSALDSEECVGMYASRINILELQNGNPIRTDVRYNHGHTYHTDGACLDNGYKNKKTREQIFCHCHAGALLKKDLLVQCGFADADYWCWYDCANLGWKARLNGWDLEFVDNALMWHRLSDRRKNKEFRAIVERNRILTILRFVPIDEQPYALHQYLTQNRSDGTTYEERISALKSAQMLFSRQYSSQTHKIRNEIYEKYCLSR